MEDNVERKKKKDKLQASKFDKRYKPMDLRSTVKTQDIPRHRVIKFLDKVSLI